MAQVTTGPLGIASGARQTVMQQSGQMKALGVDPDETARRQQQTGVDPGSQGYVSGQVAPGAQVGASPTAPPPPAGSWRATAPTSPNMGVGIGNIPAPGGGTTTTQSALTAPPGGGGGGGTAPPAGGTAPGSTSVGTQNGYSPLGPLAGPVSSVPIVGPIVGGLTSTSEADLSPTKNIQNAAAGLGANLNQERYDYRPGEAPAQGVVSLDTANADQTRVRQQAALDALTGAANGTVPSAAELQMREEAGRNAAAALGQARALGGRSAGGAARAGAMATGDILARNAVAGAQLRATEQANARNQLISALGGVRGQDIGTAESNANLRQQAYGNNLTSQEQQNQLAEKHREDLLAAQLQALGIAGTAAGNTVGASAKNAEAENKTKGGIVSGITSAFGL